MILIYIFFISLESSSHFCYEYKTNLIFICISIFYQEGLRVVVTTIKAAYKFIEGNCSIYSHLYQCRTVV